jgi:signal transduction histidine kinase
MALMLRRRTDRDANWQDFVHTTRHEAAARCRGLLAVGVVLVVVFTLFDIGLDPIRGPVLWTRVVVNATILAALGGIALALGSAWVRERVFALMFLLCALVLTVQGYSLGAVSPNPGRLAFHYLTTLGLTIVAIQWLWPWQLALGATALALFVSTASPIDPDFRFFALALAGATFLTAALARVFGGWRFGQFLTDVELRRITEEKTRQAAELGARNAELRDLFYALSHDLRAPLINMAGFTHELDAAIGALADSAGLRRPENADAPASAARAWEERKHDIEESLGFIRSNIAKMDQLVTGLLELSRIENRPVQLERVDLGQMVHGILDAFHFQIAERQIELRIGALPVVVGDPVRLNQVFSNLIDNAIKYMKPTGAARIDIECQARDDRYVFRVRDNGMGVRADDREKIFRLFTRLGHQAVPGDGLGLTVVKKIIEKHGGAIWVESEVGAGSTFCFTLPRSLPRSVEEDPSDLSTAPNAPAVIQDAGAGADFVARTRRLAV